MCKNSMYSISCSCGKYEREINRPIKVRLEEHLTAVIRGETIESGMLDHVWKVKYAYQPLWKDGIRHD